MKSLTSLHLAAIFFLLTSIGVSAQTDSLKTVLGKLGQHNGSGVKDQNAGDVQVLADTAVVHLETKSRFFKETKGYRIQIFIGSLEQAKAERSKYLGLGLPYSAYMKQVVPEQALHIGDFITRMEMEKHLELIREYYPKAFGVVELIEPPKFSSAKK